MKLKDLKAEIDILIEKFGPEMDVFVSSYVDGGCHEEPRLIAPVATMEKPRPFVQIDCLHTPP